MLNRYYKRKERIWHELILPIAIFICLAVFLYTGVGNVSLASQEENKAILQDALKRAVVQCYAIEGMYPPSIEYLEDNYGIVYDHDSFIVHYEVFAGNILPDITVILLDGK
ncbi:hypothetical protein [Sinanaerobacter chloroacetimidivorans]|jgi:hypothetical protein|uniref:Uncharacterized protein n=1 Tax=Sinanaerobacter chloroacetimidivorans TaxID=2818044 RepID=A0A8J7W3U1_9FIRM|nr:hypothetical protein [Sinanaerobacter chloroacetimidivorans]MBR0598858.1 hypothetical protein [Sinanaerobacter chloroacetimidivorans]